MPYNTGFLDPKTTTKRLGIHSALTLLYRIFFHFNLFHLYSTTNKPLLSFQLDAQRSSVKRSTATSNAMLPSALPLGLLCLALGPTFTFALPTLSPASPLSKRSFNIRQKWERNEVNCIQILNPAPGATYYPGFIVDMIYGTATCEGFEAEGPLEIHLYNNPEMREGKIRYDYHEVIADGVSC